MSNERPLWAYHSLLDFSHDAFIVFSISSQVFICIIFWPGTTWHGEYYHQSLTNGWGSRDDVTSSKWVPPCGRRRRWRRCALSCRHRSRCGSTGAATWTAPWPPQTTAGRTGRPSTGAPSCQRWTLSAVCSTTTTMVVRTTFNRPCNMYTKRKQFSRSLVAVIEWDGVA